MKKKEKNFSPQGPFLGFNSEVKLFNRLFEKSVFVFPDCDAGKRLRAAGCIANLIYSYVVNKESCEMIMFRYEKGDALIQNLALLASRCFVSYREYDAGVLVKINRRMIKKLWLNADHQITDREFIIQFVNTITGAVREISNNMNALPEEAISECDAYKSLNSAALTLSFLAGESSYAYKNVTKIIDDLVRNYKPDQKEGDLDEKKS